MIPFLFFAEEPFYVAIYKSFWGGRGGEGATSPPAEPGNLNYSWGGYVAQVADVGMIGAVLAAFCAIIVSQPDVAKDHLLVHLVLWIGVAFGTGTRGFVVFLCMPV